MSIVPLVGPISDIHIREPERKDTIGSSISQV